jgi:hypothetical protein
VILNCTPHPLAIHASGCVVHLPPRGTVPRLTSTWEVRPDTDGIPTVRTTLGTVTGLPEPKEGVFLVVSALVLAACPDRQDLRSPGEAVRDSEGKIVGCRGLCA